MYTVLLLSSHEPYRHQAMKSGTSTWVAGSAMVEVSCRGRFMFLRRRQSHMPRHQLCMCGRPLTELHLLKVTFVRTICLLIYLPDSRWLSMHIIFSGKCPPVAESNHACYTHVIATAWPWTTMSVRWMLADVWRSRWWWSSDRFACVVP